MEQLQIIPFGKYKGQPIDVLQSDKQYADWLMQQDWFREKYPQFNTIIINNFNAPQDSPEHNKLASLFLNDEFCINLFKFCNSHVTSQHRIKTTTHNPEDRGYYLYKVNRVEDNGYTVERKFELKEGSDVLIDITRTYTLYYNIMVQENLLYCEIKRYKRFYPQKPIFFSRLSGIVIETSKKHEEFSHATVEIKPTVGDDYPTVIRQCRAQKSQILFIGQFRSSVISIDDLRKMFPDIQIVLLSDITN